MSYIFRRCYHRPITFQESIICGVSVSPISQVHASAMLVLPSVENYKAQVWASLQRHKVRTKFNSNPSSATRGDTCGQTCSVLYVFTAHIAQGTHKREQSANTQTTGTISFSVGAKTTLSLYEGCSDASLIPDKCATTNSCTGTTLPMFCYVTGATTYALPAGPYLGGGVILHIGGIIPKVI
jgi:hypothetical protein